MDSKNIIRTVTVGFILILLLGLLVSFASLSQATYLRDNLSRIVEINNQKSKLVLEMRELIRMRQLSLLKMLSMSDPFEIDEETSRFYDYAGKYRIARQALLKLPITEEEKAIHKRLDEAVTIAQPLNQEAVMMFSDVNSSHEQRVSAISRAQNKQGQLFQELNALVEMQSRYTDNLFKESRDQININYTIIALTTFLLIVLGVTIAYFVTRFVKNNDATLRLKNDELLHAYKRAEAATQAKSDFLANMSHEIRTPMNGVMGMLSLLAESNLSQEQNEYLDVANKSSESLLSLLNDILDISKVEAGKLEINEEDFDLISTLEDISVLFSERARKKQISVISNIRPSIPRFVHGDQSRIEQVLRNIVSNAIKFTDAGEVRIDAEITNQDEKKFILNIKVSDTGIGIPEEFSKQLFQAFTQADSTVTRTYGGSGLGLAICKELVELMHGEIGYHHNQAGGSVFWFAIPMMLAKKESLVDERRNRFKGMRAWLMINDAANMVVMGNMLKNWGISCESEGHKSDFDILVADEPSALTDRLPHQIVMCICAYNDMSQSVDNDNIDISVSAPLRQSVIFERLYELEKEHAKTMSKDTIEQSAEDDSESVGKGRRVLVVDDNFFNQQVAVAMLKKLNFIVDLANDGQEALECLKENQYSMILMDCHMPVMDGYAATRKIREIETEKKLPANIIVAMTANVQPGNYEKCIEAGMNDFMAKPVTATLMNETVAKWL